MESIAERHRDIDVITSEIKELCNAAGKTMLLYAAEIGRRLVEAKEILPHGEWGRWLSEECGFSQRTANKHMQIFKAYGSAQVSIFGAELNSPTWANLGYSQALSLLAVPEEEREEFVKENHVEDLSARELDRLIKERDEALAKAEAAEQELHDTIEDTKEINFEKRQLEEITKDQREKLEKAQAEADELRETLRKAKEAEENAKEKLKKLKESPEIPQELRDKLKAEAAEEANEQIKKGVEEAEAKAREAEAARALAESEAEAARSKAEELRKAVAAADPAVSEFKILFTQVQENMDKMIDRMRKIEDSVMRRKLANAVKAVLDKYSGNVTETQ